MKIVVGDVGLEPQFRFPEPVCLTNYTTSPIFLLGRVTETINLCFGSALLRNIALSECWCTVVDSNYRRPLQSEDLQSSAIATMRTMHFICCAEFFVHVRNSTFTKTTSYGGTIGNRIRALGTSHPRARPSTPSVPYFLVLRERFELSHPKGYRYLTPACLRFHHRSIFFWYTQSDLNRYSLTRKSF